MKDYNDYVHELYSALIKLKSEDDCRMLLEDLCTYKEVEQMAQRAYAAKLLLGGRTYGEIIAETDISSTTLSRISRSITHGSGGYKKFIDYDKKGK